MDIKEDIGRALEGLAALHSLSNRETDILRLLVNKVVSAEDIANELGISRNTVRIHFQNIFNKMRTSSKAEVLGKFIEYVIEGSYLKTSGIDGRRMTIVMVDDDRAYKDLVKRSLDKLITEGFEFIEFGNGEQVVSYVIDEQGRDQFIRPDLILLDLDMPVLNGFQTLEKLKGNDKAKDIPVVVFTTSDEPDDVHRIYQLGANSFVSKPTGFRSLVEVMNGILNYWCEIGALPGSSAAGKGS